MSPIRTYKEITPSIENSSYIDPTATVIGSVVIGAESSVWPMVVIRGDVNEIRIGSKTNIQDGSILHVTHESPYYKGRGLFIGDEVTVGHQAVLHACTIGDRVLIGMSAIILDGAVIPSEVMIGAGSLVPPEKELESGYLYLGQPVKKARPLTQEEKEYLIYSSKHYINLKNQYMS